ncbi:hypothetical protein B0T17DRAFT_534283 [Bombardia bombarda]|uniref:Uncharacterized protein n=1 Tax=Bombardia bombarda TaxID=252184 RepID=A0AA39WU49_9PEZI|nr:hypothetical protein B0T17DRAFT_534283 [Bombardia bombarda]
MATYLTCDDMRFMLVCRLSCQWIFYNLECQLIIERKGSLQIYNIWGVVAFCYLLFACHVFFVFFSGFSFHTGMIIFFLEGATGWLFSLLIISAPNNSFLLILLV